MSKEDRAGLAHIGKSRKPRNIKLHNERLVLFLLREAGSTTAGEIASRINLSITTVMRIVNSLKSIGVIRSAGKGESTDEGGKKPELFAVNEDFRYAVGGYINSRRVSLGLYDFTCRETARKTTELEPGLSLDEVLKTAAETLRTFCAEEDIPAEKVCGVTFGFDGIVDAERGVLYYPIHDVSWGRDIPVHEKLTALLPDFSPIYVDNGGRFAAYRVFLTYPEYRNTKFFDLRVGWNYAVGCFISNGRLERGANGFLGEIGHMSLLPEGEGALCACGGRGCFETLVSGQGVQHWARRIGRTMGTDDPLFQKAVERTLTPQEIFDAADAGNEYARLVTDKVAGFFCQLIRNIILTCDPEIITLGDLYAGAGNYFRSTLENQIEAIPFFQIESRLKIRYSTAITDSAGQIGGALYAIDSCIQDMEFV